MEKTGKHASSGHLFRCNLLCVVLILFLPQWSFRKKRLGSLIKEGRQERSRTLQTSTNFFLRGKWSTIIFLIVLAEVGGIEFVHSLLNLVDNTGRLSRPDSLCVITTSRSNIVFDVEQSHHPWEIICFWVCW